MDLLAGYDSEEENSNTTKQTQTQTQTQTQQTPTQQTQDNDSSKKRKLATVTIPLPTTKLQVVKNTVEEDEDEEERNKRRKLNDPSSLSSALSFLPKPKFSEDEIVRKPKTQTNNSNNNNNNSGDGKKTQIEPNRLILKPRLLDDTELDANLVSISNKQNQKERFPDENKFSSLPTSNTSDFEEYKQPESEKHQQQQQQQQYEEADEQQQQYIQDPNSAVDESYYYNQHQLTSIHQQQYTASSVPDQLNGFKVPRGFREANNAKIIEINAAEVQGKFQKYHIPKEFEQEVALPSSELLPTRRAKSQNHISSLYYKSLIAEQELGQKKAERSQNKRESRNRYGW